VNVLLDTNILTRWVNTASREHKTAAGALRKLREDGHVPCLVPQNLYEFWVVATRPIAANGLGMSASDVRAEIDRFTSGLFNLMLDERAIFEKWKELVTTHAVIGKPAHDARLAAAMFRHKLTHVLSFDKTGFSRFNGIIVVEPAEFVAGKASIQTRQN